MVNPRRIRWFLESGSLGGGGLASGRSGCNPGPALIKTVQVVRVRQKFSGLRLDKPTVAEIKGRGVVPRHVRSRARLALPKEEAPEAEVAEEKQEETPAAAPRPLKRLRRMGDSSSC